jgi:hypothetical protein
MSDSLAMHEFQALLEMITLLTNTEQAYLQRLLHEFYDLSNVQELRQIMRRYPRLDKKLGARFGWNLEDVEERNAVVSRVQTQLV